MLLTITTTIQPATDLGYLLHKSPARVQSFPLGFGTATVFYPEATEERCTVALMVEVDPVGLVRRPKGASEGGLIRQYVNDRPYAASSHLCSAIAEVFGTAMGGRSKERQALAETAIPLEAHIPVLPCRGGDSLIRELFAPLGYEVTIAPIALDPAFPAWGASRYHDVRLRGTVRIAELLTHLFVLIPVLDEEKHYYVAGDEVDKLLRKGEGWLESHPKKDVIVRRYWSLTPHGMPRRAQGDALVAETRLDPYYGWIRAACDDEGFLPLWPMVPKSVARSIVDS